MLADALTAYYTQGVALHHYEFVDSSGAEYRLDQNNGNVWTSIEGIYVSYDANVGRLYFTDGSFWVFGCTSAGTEEDSGAMYPTLMEDTNGNQILVRYAAGVNVPWTNSSSRILQIEDMRAVLLSGSRSTYQFTYNTDAIPHLTGIANNIGTAEKYTFTTGTAPLASPFSPPTSYGTWTFLDSIKDGELTQVTFPYVGHLRWPTPTTFIQAR